MVYFLEEAGSGKVKIGYTQDYERLRARIKTLQAGNPNELKLVAVAERGGPKTERKLHKILGKYRIRGEWFRAVKAVKAVIDYVNEHPDLWPTDFSDEHGEFHRTFAPKKPRPRPTMTPRRARLAEKRRREREVIAEIKARDEAKRFATLSDGSRIDKEDYDAHQKSRTNK